MFFGAGEKVVRKHGLEEGGEIGFAAEGASTMGFAGPPLLVVVLLMEPKSRRFELLQLEFDSGRATVADVLAIKRDFVQKVDARCAPVGELP